MIQTFAEPAKKILTEKALAIHAEDGCTPTCRVCGHKLKVGDFVDPFHPYAHAGNLHQQCAADAPKPRS